MPEARCFEPDLLGRRRFCPRRDLSSQHATVTGELGKRGGPGGP